MYAGLFHKAIIMGMYKYWPSGIVPKENSTIAFKLAKNLGYDGTSDNKKLLSFYKKLNMRTLIFARLDRFMIKVRLSSKKCLKNRGV